MFFTCLTSEHVSLVLVCRDHALFQCVEESLKKSGVLLNYVKSRDDEADECEQRHVKWHDLSPNEYADAAAQVHSVVFAQLGTLSREFLSAVFPSHVVNFNRLHFSSTI